jgi:ATP-dependent DNA helicase RecQ
MKVVIVAKTRMGSGACIGALTFDGRSLRLIAPDAGTNDHFNMEYNIGEVWEIDGAPPSELIAPHTENIIVRHKRRLPPIDDVAAFARQQMPPRAGGPEMLYDGLAQRASTGALYIAESSGVPGYSTLFWQPDQPLVRATDSKRIRYRYGDGDQSCTLTFVGFQEPVEVIPAGALVRVSLAHWWRPEERPQDEFRCYVQLSGWFAPVAQPYRAEMPEQFKAQRDAPPVFTANLDEALALLKQVYGYDDFRPLQAEIIDNILNKRDTLAVMPTGSGKSLCYQLPALLFPGLTVVVSPLISLMEDQVMQLRELGVAAAYLNSTLSYDAYLATTRAIRAGTIKLVYAAPETLLRPETLVLLEQCPVDCLTIDEAHCISEWGHDFRPEFRQLIEVRQRLPGAVCLAVTATATGRVREDIKELDIGPPMSSSRHSTARICSWPPSRGWMDWPRH